MGRLDRPIPIKNGENLSNRPVLRLTLTRSPSDQRRRFKTCSKVVSARLAALLWQGDGEPDAEPVSDRARRMKGLSRQNYGLLLAFLGMLMFSGTVPATRLAVEGLDPYFVTTARAAIAGLLAGLALLVLRRSLPGRRQFRLMVMSAFCVVIGFPGFLALGLQTVPAAHAGVVLGVMPLLTAAAAALLIGERPSRLFWLFAVLGAVVVVAFALRDGGGSFDIGDFFLFAAALSGAVGYVYSGKLSRDMPGWEVISWVLVISLPVILPAALWLMPAAPAAVPASAWAGLAYVALFSMFVGFFAWNAGMALAGVARASQMQLLQTFATLGLAALVNGEHVDGPTIAAAVAVVAIVALGQRAKVAGG
jgi:drug/metabolite transporter (DMT)-like permease